MGGLSQQASPRPVSRRGRTEPYFQFVVQIRRDRASSGDRPSSRPQACSTHRLPSPSGRRISTTLPSPQPGLLRRRQRSTSPPSGRSARTRQRPPVTSTNDTQCRTASTHREGAQDARATRSRSCRRSVETSPLCPTSLGFGGVGQHQGTGPRPAQVHG